MPFIYLFGNEAQCNTIRRSLDPAFEIIESTDLQENDFTSRIDKITDLDNDSTFIVFADNFQKNKIISLYPQRFRNRYTTFSTFSNSTVSQPLDNKVNSNTEVLLMGMSHSQCGIDESMFAEHQLFKMAAPSMDLFLHLKYAIRFAEIYPDVTTRIKKVFLELPYYIFNYDLSLFGDFTKTKLIYFKTVNDYHNFGKSEYQREQIEEFEVFLSVINHNNSCEKTNSTSINSVKTFVKHYVNDYRVAKNHDNVWFKQYDQTIKENRDIYYELLETLKRIYINANIEILIMPFNPVFIRTHQQVIKEKRNLFYDIIKQNDVMIHDDFTFFKSSWNFSDHCHMNKRGICVYSNQFRKYMPNLSNKEYI